MFNKEQYGPTDSELSSPFGELIFHKGDFFKAGAAPCLCKNSAKKKGKDLVATVERQTRSNQMRFQLRCYINRPGWWVITCPLRHEDPFLKLLWLPQSSGNLLPQGGCAAIPP